MKNIEKFSSLVLLLLLLCNTVSSFIPEEKDEPCDFFATINITDGQRFANGSIVYENIEYTKVLYSEYNFIITNLTIKLSVSTHTRGCLCLLKNCVRVCCLPGQITSKEVCVDNEQYEVSVNLIKVNLESTPITIREQDYGIIYGRPCGAMYLLWPEEDSSDEWTFLKVCNNFF